LKRAILVRHGDIAADMSRYWGHTDVALSGAGRAQAQRLRDRLASEEIDGVYSSDLRRALDTAAIIAGRLHAPVLRCAELREIGFGQCEGLTFDEMTMRFPSTNRIWTADDHQASFPGGESLSALAERVAAFAGSLRQRSGNAALVVAHGGSLRVLICCLTGLDLSAWRQLHIDRASLSVIELHDHGGKVMVLNDVSHLVVEGRKR
jgi:broad specificity phosphatase PhoE